MKKIIRDDARKFAFDYNDKPLLHVKAGERFEIETWDAGSGFFKSAADKAIPGNRPGFDRVPPLANPIAGPVFIDGLERGDTLVVNIHEIEVEKTHRLRILRWFKFVSNDLARHQTLQ
jgi:acetamidase/formamidase